MKKPLSIFDTWMLALTFAEANETDTARQILKERKMAAELRPVGEKRRRGK